MRKNIFTSQLAILLLLITGVLSSGGVVYADDKENKEQLTKYKWGSPFHRHYWTFNSDETFIYKTDGSTLDSTPRTYSGKWSLRDGTITIEDERLFGKVKKRTFELKWSEKKDSFQFAEVGEKEDNWYFGKQSCSPYKRD